MRADFDTKCPVCAASLQVKFLEVDFELSGEQDILREDLACSKGHYTYHFHHGATCETVGECVFPYRFDTSRAEMNGITESIKAAVEHVRREDEKVEKVWNDFWAPICTDNGVLNLDQVKRELFDFKIMMRNTAEVFEHVSGGQASNPSILASVINALNDDLITQSVEAAVKEEVQIRKDT